MEHKRQNQWKIKSGSAKARRSVTSTAERRPNKERDQLWRKSWQAERSNILLTFSTAKCTPSLLGFHTTFILSIAFCIISQFLWLWCLMIEYCSVHVYCDFSVVWKERQWADCKRSERHWVEVNDKVVYSTTAKRWATGVPTIGVPSKPTIDYVHTQRATELQELWPVFVGFVVIVVPRGI